MRLSVGATRGRLIQQLLTESTIIALAGGVAGSLLAWWSFQGLLAWLFSSLPGTIPEMRIDAHPNLTVLWFALGLTAIDRARVRAGPRAAGVEAGRVRGDETGRHRLGRPDRRSRWRFRTTTRGGWLRGMLVGIQVAVCMVLLISAGLLMRALYSAQTTDPDFQYRNVAVVSVSLRGQTMTMTRKLPAFQRRLLERVAALPGVESVAQVEQDSVEPGPAPDDVSPSRSATSGTRST